MKPRRWMAIFDTHGDMLDYGAWRIVREFMREWKPQIRVHGGDAFDMRFLRRGADVHEQNDGVKGDIEAGCELLSQFQPTHFLRGNHDERLWDVLTPRCRDDKLKDFASYMIRDIEEVLGDKCQVLPYDKRAGVLNLGHLRIIHGYHSGMTAAKQAAQVYGACLMGHIHSVDQAPVPRLENTIGRACGCICKLDLGYNRAQAGTLKQSHGFAYGLLHSDGTYHVWQAQPINGLWVMPTEFKEYRQ